MKKFIFLLTSSLFLSLLLTDCNVRKSNQSENIHIDSLRGQQLFKNRKKVDERNSSSLCVNPTEKNQSYPFLRLKNLCFHQKLKDRSFKDFKQRRMYEIEYSDTFYTPKNTFISYSDVFSRTNVLFDDAGILMEDPTLNICRMKAQGGNVFFVQTAYMGNKIDISMDEEVKFLDSFNKCDSFFVRFTQDYNQRILSDGQRSIYSLTVDYPKTNYQYRDAVVRWLKKQIVESGDSGLDLSNNSREHNISTVEALGELSSNQYFMYKRKEYPIVDDIPSFLVSVNDLRLCLRTNHFLTYQHYHYDYDGGTHGYYTSYLRSFDFGHNEEIDCNYLFKFESIEIIKKLLLDEAFNSEYFKLRTGLATFEDVCLRFAHVDNVAAAVKKMKLPCPGLSEDGVVFSYPPYALDSFSSGCFHFVIPYGKMLPYLTPEAKRLLEIKQ